MNAACMHMGYERVHAPCQHYVVLDSSLLDPLMTPKDEKCKLID